MRSNVLIVLLGLTVLTLAISASTTAQVRLDLSPYPSLYGGETIEVSPGDTQALYFQIDDGTETGSYYVSDVSFLWQASDAGGSAILVDLQVPPDLLGRVTRFYTFGIVQVSGIPSTVIEMQIELVLDGYGSVRSNSVYTHITPEPSSMLALGTGLLGVGGLILKRRRS